MPFNRPSLATLIDRTATDIETRLPGADARLRRSNLTVLARVLAAVAHGLYGFLEWIFRQLLPDTSEAEVLERQANLYGITRKPAAAASGFLAVTGTNGVVIPIGTTFIRADGQRYTVTLEATIVAGTATVILSAETAGQAGNAVSGTKLNVESPIAGLGSEGTITAAALTGGADLENDDALRGRLLLRLRNPPMGGAAHDYVAWALEVAGVTRAWCYPLQLGPGTVMVRFVRDDDASIIPDQAEIDAVQAHIAALRPVTAAVTVASPIPDALNFTIHLSPDTASTRAAVEAELRDLLRREAVPEGGAGEGVVLRSHLDEAASLAAGETDHVMTVPAANVAPALGHMAVFGVITWV